MNYKNIPIAYGRTVTCPEDIFVHLTVISADDPFIPHALNVSQAVQLNKESRDAVREQIETLPF